MQRKYKKGIFSSLNDKCKSFFLPIIISSICILGLVVLIIGFNYSRNSKIIQTNIENSNMLINQEVKTTVDDKIDMLITRLYDYCYDKNVMQFAAENNLNDPAVILKALDILKYNNQLVSTYRQINDVFIYFANTNIIINKDGYYSLSDFNAKMSDFHFTQEDIASTLNSYKNFDFLYAPDSNKNVILLKSLPLGSRTNITASIGIGLSGNDLANTLNKLSIENSMYTYIITSSGKVISSSDNARSEEINIPEDLRQKESGHFYQKVNNDESLITFIKSTNSDWIYVSVMPANVMLEELNSFRLLSVIILLIFLMFFTLLIFYVRKKSFNPVKRLIDDIKSKYSSDRDTSKNEIQIISDTLERLSYERERIIISMKEQYPVIRNNILISLLKEIKISDSMYGKMTEMDIVFKYNRFVVLCIDFEESPEFEPIEFKGERVSIKSITSNIAQDVFRIAGDIFPVEFNWDKMVIIINTDREPAEACDMVCSCSEELINLLKMTFSFSISIGVSSCKEDIKNVTYLYQEAQEALEYKLLSGINTVNSFKNSEFSTDKYFYPTYIEHKLINSVASGNEAQALEILQTIFDNNFKSNSHPVKYSRILFFDVISTVLKLLNELKLDLSDIFDDQFDAEKKLLECKTVNEMHNVVSKTIIEICKYVNAKAKSKNDKLVTTIIDYIDKNYCSESICITSIADAVDITENYLSHYFKEKMGSSVMKYIENLRIEKIKTLLKETELTLSDITQLTGFSNSAVLIRAFKKNEGITPGQFREM
jgi:AraC-type DNA-binding domain-containing proteins